MSYQRKTKEDQERYPLDYQPRQIFMQKQKPFPCRDWIHSTYFHLSKLKIEMRTLVQFYQDGSQILAVFPFEDEDAGRVSCYAHVGQHSATVPEYYTRLPRATRAQYSGLKKELEGPPYRYKLKVI